MVLRPIRPEGPRNTLVETIRKALPGQGPERARRPGRRAGELADPVEVPQGLGVRVDQGGLAVRQAVLGAECRDEGLGSLQAGPGHRREQVMLDLVVQSPQGEISEPAASDIAGSEHLPAQVVGLVRGGEHRHPLVVRRERAAQVEPEQALLYQDENHGPDRREH